MQATEEQVNINALVSARKNVVVGAGAGSGKSSTLRYIAQQNPELNFLVLCFNTANAKESNEHVERPSNIFYSTLHSIAYREVVDAKMRKKLQPYLNYLDIDSNVLTSAGFCDSAMDAKDEKRILILLRRGIQDCITHYCRSDSSSLLDFAVRMFEYWFTNDVIEESDDDVANIPTKSVALTTEQQYELAIITRKYWLTLIDVGSSYSITHDVYLKLYQLRDCRISYFYDKDSKQEVAINCLCLDEAQDTNPVAQAIFDNSGLQKVIVGDRYQQLYAWRGATNVMADYPHFSKGTLTTSFRFNQQIADMANVVLHIAGSGMQLTGAGKQTTINTKAHLCRTNLSVVSRIFANISYDPEVMINTNIDFKEVISKLYHINAVSFNQTPKFPNKSLKDITDKKSLEEALAMSDDLKQLVRLSILLTKSSEGGLTTAINTMKNHIVNDGSGSITISTIHKSKGLEYSEVTIDDDIVKFKRDSEGVIFNREEALEDFWESYTMNCLLYVAITRAKVKCNLPEYLQEAFI